MAPTVCMPDFIEMGKSHSYSRRRQKNQDGSIRKRQKVELNKFPNKNSENLEMSLSHPLSPISRPRCQTDSYVPIILRPSQEVSTRISSMQNNHWKMILRRNGMMDIFVRTIALVKRNYILQKRVIALREETQNFISSVMSNPENMPPKMQETPNSEENNEVSSTTEINSRSSLPSVSESRTDSDSNQVSSSSAINQEDTV